MKTLVVKWRLFFLGSYILYVTLVDLPLDISERSAKISSYCLRNIR